MGEQAEDAPEVAEHPPETPAVAEPEEASTFIEIPRERETLRERMLKRLNALRIVHGARPVNCFCFSPLSEFFAPRPCRIWSFVHR